jgi:hypothetical protein
MTVERQNIKKGAYNDANAAVQHIMDALKEDTTDAAMELKALTIAVASASRVPACGRGRASLTLPVCVRLCVCARVYACEQSAVSAAARKVSKACPPS